MRSSTDIGPLYIKSDQSGLIGNISENLKKTPAFKQKTALKTHKQMIF